MMMDTTITIRLHHIHFIQQEVVANPYIDMGQGILECIEENNELLCLSYILNKNTPSYGNRNKFNPP